MSNIGPTGSQGQQGLMGIRGAQGLTGPTGSYGLTGKQGIQGVTGPTGRQGTQGITGPSGSFGLMGLRGVTGLTGTAGKQGIQGPTGKQGIQGITGYTGATGMRGIPGPSIGFTGPKNSVLFYDGTTVTGTTGLSFSSKGFQVDGNVLPYRTNTSTLGSTDAVWKSLHLGGTIDLSGSGDAVGIIGTDPHGIVYTKSGFATPFINVGPTMNALNPVAIGGWVIGPTGTYGDPEYDLIAQQKSLGAALPDGLTGEIFSLTRPLGNVIPTPDLNGITTRDPSADLTVGSVGDTGLFASHRPIVLRDKNENIIVEIMADQEGNGSIRFGGGSNSISMNNGLSISNITHADDNADIQPLSYNTNGKVTYGQLNYAHFLGFPRLPNYESNAAANAAIALDPFFDTPQMGQMYFNRVSKKAMVYDGTQWNVMG